MEAFDQAFDTLVDRLTRIVDPPIGDAGGYEYRLAMLEAKVAFRDAVVFAIEESILVPKTEAAPFVWEPGILRGQTIHGVLGKAPCDKCKGTQRRHLLHGGESVPCNSCVGDTIGPDGVDLFKTGVRPDTAALWRAVKAYSRIAGDTHIPAMGAALRAAEGA